MIFFYILAIPIGVYIMYKVITSLDKTKFNLGNNFLTVCIIVGLGLILSWFVAFLIPILLIVAGLVILGYIVKVALENEEE